VTSVKMLTTVPTSIRMLTKCTDINLDVKLLISVTLLTKPMSFAMLTKLTLARMSSTIPTVRMSTKAVELFCLLDSVLN